MESYYAAMQEDGNPNRQVHIKDTPHTRFCITRSSNCEVFIVFPRLYNRRNSCNYLTLDMQTAFIDHIFLPAVFIACKNANRFPNSMKRALASGFTTQPTSFLPVHLLAKVVRQMR